jgi:hypothetical protein
MDEADSLARRAVDVQPKAETAVIIGPCEQLKLILELKVQPETTVHCLPQGASLRIVVRPFGMHEAHDTFA